MEIFEQASRLKLRFETKRGCISTEDLWDLPLSNDHGLSLDNLAKGLNRKLKEEGEESFVVPKSQESSILSLQFELVKHVIKVKIEERDAKEQALKKKAKKQKIREIIADKEDETLKNLSEDELRKMLDDL
ncbi:hypothetical protein PN36_30635 [Candidatus Thiomargarita nelsonii]|uniref:Uncharacterized protein n=1 Tax=Candidatus Thiomargarita nelsonii TaxID=1003181 RepID=A0A0A6PG06_9GAMM|nr:hypothetical protein PN36_30635 [Candidatus Thiomargarita nelsonii]